MNHVLLWKEYRQQRAIWLAIALLGILLILILGLALGQGSGLDVFRDGSIRPTLVTIILALGVTYGMVSGTMLLAGEKEDRTLDFLDGLSGERGAVWHNKAVAGALFTLAQAMVMALLLMALGLGSWRTGLIVLYWCLDALAWGLLGGSLCKKVLTAVLAGVAFMAASWLLALIANNNTELYLGKALLAGAGVFYSRRIFCRDDPTRQAMPDKSRFTHLLPASWRVLLWLTVRQGRWVLAGGLGFAVILGGALNFAPLILWPIGTLLLGLACGLAAFCPDQNDGERFLGAQRFSPGRIWTAKILFWAMATIVLTALTWEMAIFAKDRLFSDVFIRNSNDWFHVWPGRDNVAQTISPAVFLGLWPLYGFCLGQYFALVVPRPVLALILAVFITPLMVGLWVPSLVFGGVPVWQLLMIPILLLLTTRLAIWPWFSGRLFTGRLLAGIASAAASMVLIMAGFLWYRAVEVPDVGEPFDMKAYFANLPSAEKNEAGPLLRSACKAMAEQRKQVEDKLGAPSPSPDNRGGYRRFLDEVLEKGWPKKDEEIGPWLDHIFQGKWVNLARNAAELPLGMVDDPRLTSFFTATAQCFDMGGLLMARALQWQARGDSETALDLLDTALALSRQLKNHSRHFEDGHYMEEHALAGYYHWLEKIGPDKKLLKSALAMLLRHEAESPDPLDQGKAQYLVLLNSQPDLHAGKVRALETFAYQAPWEKERQERIFRAICQANLRQAQQPLWKIVSTSDFKEKHIDQDTQTAMLLGLPPEDGPGSNVSAKKWGELMKQTWLRYGPGIFLHGIKRDLQSVRAAQTVTALALYQADNGKPPAKLADLLPAYLKALPIDPYTGKPFDYRISKGEEINGFFPSGGDVNRRLTPGQAVVWSAGSLYKFPVPFWKK